MINTKNVIKSEEKSTGSFLSFQADEVLVNRTDKEAVIKEIMRRRALAKEAAAKAKKIADKPAPTYVYVNNTAVEVDGKKVAVGPKKKGGKRCAQNDPGRELIRAAIKSIIEANSNYNTKMFEHTAEGIVISLSEADYTLKVSKSKEAKFDIKEKDFKAEKDFSSRGSVKNSAPGIARSILIGLEDPEVGFTFDLCAARASGITIQIPQGEYTIKISKKRDRVGFEAEKASAYENKK